jgi:UDP-N-acetylglucosamine acyltransferase
MAKHIFMSDLYDPHARFDASNSIHPTAIIYENVTLGKNNTIGAYSVIGSNGEIRGVAQDQFRGTVEIGDGNVISEHVTIQRPAKQDSVTKIGDNNLIMAHSHVGHDVLIGNDTEICTGVILGGYSIVADKAKLKLGVTVRNRKRVGIAALVGLGAAVVKDVADDAIVVGNPARPLVK